MPQQHRADAAQRSRIACQRARVIARPPRRWRGRGRCRGTPPRDCRGHSARRASAGAPRSTMLSGLHHQHVLAQPLDLGHVVRGEQDRRARRALIALEIGAHPVGRIGIEARRRLVEQQHLGLVEQRLRQRRRGSSGPTTGSAGLRLEQRLQVEIGGQLADARAARRGCRRAARRPSGSRRTFRRLGKST